MIIQICEKCHKPNACPEDACVCHATKAERERICEEIIGLLWNDKESVYLIRKNNIPSEGKYKLCHQLESEIDILLKKLQ